MLRALIAAVCCGICLFTIGCGAQGAKSLTLDEALARQSLTKVLDTWKAGQKSDTLKTTEPAITTNDWAWDHGYKLTAYKLTGGDRNDGANLHCNVELTLVDAKNRPAKQTATFVVGTSPVITVFRQ